MKQKAFLHLPVEYLLDSLMHLPPFEVDALRFVSRAHNSLVGKHGAWLPKHSIDLYKPTPAWASATTEHAIWFTEQHSYNNSYGGGLTLAGLKSMLESVRLGRISKLTIEENSQLAQIFNIILDAARMEISVGTVELRGRHYNNLIGVLSLAGKLPGLKCLEVAGVEGIFSYSQIYRHIPHFIYHFPRDFPYNRIISFLGDGQFRGRAAFILDKDFHYGVPMVRKFIEKIAHRFTATRSEGDLHFPKGDFLLLYFFPGGEQSNENWEAVLGRPDEHSHHIAEWPADFAIYSQLNNYSWRVWRVRNSHIPTAEGAVACKSYMRVMQKISRGREDKVSLAVHFQLFGFDGYAESE